jgi:hypothetical protein
LISFILFYFKFCKALRTYLRSLAASWWWSSLKNWNDLVATNSNNFENIRKQFHGTQPENIWNSESDENQNQNIKQL